MALLPVSSTTHSYVSDYVGSEFSRTRADYNPGSPGSSDQVTVSQAARDASTAARNLETSDHSDAQDTTAQAAKTSVGQMEARIASDSANPVTHIRDVDQQVEVRQHEERLANQKADQTVADTQAQLTQQGTTISVVA